MNAWGGATLDGRDLEPAPHTPEKNAKKTYSTEDSLVVTDPTTSSAVGSLSMGEQTGSRVLYHLWPYVIVSVLTAAYIVARGGG